MLFPAIQPTRTMYIQVSADHELYIEECGKADGVPIVFLHGGPGGSCEPAHRRYYDPERYRIILFDQRGCGKSRPHASLENNTTQDLIDDLEKIREHLEIDKWVVFGGSWGSTLALAYAEAHVDRVLGLVLRGIFLCRQQDVDWFYQGGAARLFPDAWQDFIAPIPENERSDLVTAYHKRLTSDNELERMAAAKAWSIWEGSTATLRKNSAVIDYFSDPHIALSIARIECHYFINNSFFEENQLLENAYKLKHIPGFIVHGRYDVICPIDQAFALHDKWPNAQLKVIADAGHAVSEEGIVKALVESTNTMLRLLE
ncbi:MAG: prolyl aminopeptidase [Gammaproteobacteria bacterium]|jgi:proline iminopeptidase|nr:prolyl aminopeptidase [Gammaproteobacteria bacterium]MBT3722266.1 prolyl aminopeptidase [Gammaproteobacteria bacterium]MBT4076362.1 prolyl aminopeptidase [Gammaproteobacteria bacterium]MBT4193638.1 prolyl aminopeptidase [Gammaproteobacteria bacterium]MBT4450608.1 prolyl aminopeptidase [Gammaproteobacteria bacterium]